MSEGFSVRFHESIGSTSDEAKALAAAGAADGKVIWAAEQTAGRGRQGRGWTSPPGNLYCSVLLRPEMPESRLMELGFVAALAVAEAASAFLPAETVRLKWPNDVLAGGGKLAGILTEGGGAEGGGTARPWAVIGMGVNVASAPAQPAYPVVCLADFGPAPPVRAVLDALLAALARQRQTWEQQGFSAIRAAWLARGHRLGEALSVRSGETSRQGCFAGLDQDGALLLWTGAGVERVVAGTVAPAPV